MTWRTRGLISARTMSSVLPVSILKKSRKLDTVLSRMLPLTRMVSARSRCSSCTADYAHQHSCNMPLQHLSYERQGSQATEKQAAPACAISSNPPQSIQLLVRARQIVHT